MTFRIFPDGMVVNATSANRDIDGSKCVRLTSFEMVVQTPGYRHYVAGDYTYVPATLTWFEVDNITEVRFGHCNKSGKALRGLVVKTKRYKHSMPARPKAIRWNTKRQRWDGEAAIGLAVDHYAGKAS